jgi:hypothetical protein
MAPAPSLHRLSTDASREDWTAWPLADVVQVPPMPDNPGWRNHKLLSTDFQARALTPFAPTSPWRIALLKEIHPVPSIEIPAAVKTVSVALFAVCAVSLALWRLSGLFYISPLISLLGCLGAILMFALSVRIEREWRHGA